MFAVAITGVCRAVQASFQRPAPYSPSAASGYELAGLTCSTVQSRQSDGGVHRRSAGGVEGAAPGDPGAARGLFRSGRVNTTELAGRVPVWPPADGSAAPVE